MSGAGRLVAGVTFLGAACVDIRPPAELRPCMTLACAGDAGPPNGEAGDGVRGPDAPAGDSPRGEAAPPGDASDARPPLHTADARDVPPSSPDSPPPPLDAAADAGGADLPPGDGPPPPTGELIANGGFEGMFGPWSSTGSGIDYHLRRGVPRTGDGYVTLGSSSVASGALHQQITIPAGAAPRLTFWLNITSSETPDAIDDSLLLEVRNPAGNLRATLDAYSNLDADGAVGAYRMQGPFDLRAFAGGTVRIQFRLATDAAGLTTFRVDDVSVR